MCSIDTAEVTRMINAVKDTAVSKDKNDYSLHHNFGVLMAMTMLLIKIRQYENEEDKSMSTYYGETNGLPNNLTKKKRFEVN